ncbi:MAG: glycosyltransferase family 1 protein [Clostridium sp.]|jgi:glycosyltransferase, family 1|nr:MAG: glycosyl transferase family 1 [Clostridium sp. CAG:245_30_32]PWM79213.1 MAG: glycosyltransferase family 1 protein [Clostridium sp.]CDA59584.1 glycosyl transferase group 1 [Clostridium sp. CAG:245]
MKILMLTWEYPPRIVGGIARVVHDLSKRLIKDGHEVTVVTYRDNADVPEYENDKGVNVYRVDNYMIHPNNFIDWIMQLNFNMLSKATEIINKEGGFDVIHAHDWLVTYAAKSLKNAYDIPIVATIHATEAGRNSGIHDETQRYINDTEWLLTYEATEVIVNSNYMKNEIQRLFGLPFDKINVIPNGINLSNFTGIERDYDFRRQYAMDNEKIILYVGRLVYEKGVQHLIAAMPKILSNYNDAKLIIAGRGGMMDELRAEASNLGLNDKIYFTGYLNSKQVQKMYKCADVAVFPSTYEPFGIVALEAMLAGVPTVVSDVGGLDEIVTHGVDGMKSYAGNANSIADSVTALLYDHQLATNVSKKAKQKVKDQFNWEKIAQDTHFTYEKAICQTMAERQAKQMLQEKAKKTEKAENSQKEITNLLSFKKRHAYA